MGPVWGPGAGGRGQDSFLAEKLRVRGKLGNRPEKRSAPPAQSSVPRGAATCTRSLLQCARPRPRARGRGGGGSHDWRGAVLLSGARLRLCPSSGAGGEAGGTLPRSRSSLALARVPARVWGDFRTRTVPWLPTPTPEAPNAGLTPFRVGAPGETGAGYGNGGLRVAPCRRRCAPGAGR